MRHEKQRFWRPSHDGRHERIIFARDYCCGSRVGAIHVPTRRLGRDAERNRAEDAETVAVVRVGGLFFIGLALVALVRVVTWLEYRGSSIVRLAGS